MSAQAAELDGVFNSLADPTRRDILKRVSIKELTIGEIAQHYKMSFAAISKHLKVLEKAKLIVKSRKGKQQVVHISPTAFKDATDYLEYYRKLWEERLDSLEEYLKNESKKEE